MPTPIFVLIVIVILVVIGFGFAWMARPPRPDSGPSRKEYQALENLVYELRELAYSSRDVEPNLSFQITDRIQKFNNEASRRRQIE